MAGRGAARIVVDASDPGANQIDEAAAVIRAGGLVAVATDTLYGLAASAVDRGAVQRVLDVKGRDAERGLPLIGSDVAQVEAQLGALADLAGWLAARFWPGPLSLVLPAPAALPDEVTGGRGTVAVRVPAQPVARALCRAAGVMLTATSANRTGEPPAADPGDITPGLADLVLDSGPAPGGPPSTILAIAGNDVRLVRQGATAWPQIEACVQEWRRVGSARRSSD
jgi:L-threonylcarbamoyladenylate synthase